MEGENIVPASPVDAGTGSVPAAEPSAPISTPDQSIAQAPIADANAGGQTQQAQVNPELYELPDGSKVDAATLAREWKENFMPDYTQKAQTVKQLQQVVMGGQPQQQQQTINNPQQVQPPAWQDPNWVPQTYSEIVQAAAQQMQLEQQQQVQQQEAYKQQVNQFVNSQISEIKQKEPNLSEELLFQHATKYGFTDLKTAYQNMKDFNLAVQRTQQQTVQNMQTRANDPIAVRPGQVSQGTGIDFKSTQTNIQNGSAIDMLRRIQGN